MREATIRFSAGGMNINEIVVYEADKEESVLMKLIRARIRDWIRENYRGFKRTIALSVCPKGLGLMKEIVARANREYSRQDPLPTCWADLRAWGEQRGYLAIKELIC